MRLFINKYFDLIILSAGIIGFFAPSVGDSAPQLVLGLVFVIIFSSYFRLDWQQHSLTGELPYALAFVALRFVALPVVLFLLIQPVSLFWASLLLILGLLPAAVSSPAISSLFGANFALALSVTVISNFLSVVTIPLLSAWLISSSLHIAPLQLFKTLFLSIILSFLIHLPLRRAKGIRLWMQTNNPILTVFSLSAMYIISVSRNKAILLSNLPLQGMYLAAAAAIYLILFVAGYFVFYKTDTARKTALSFNSGMHNVGLGVSLSMLYFPAEYTGFFAVGQLAWALVLIPVKQWYGYLLKKNTAA